jgi:pimeloyl-ACP methyl ester carboxylesterase
MQPPFMKNPRPTGARKKGLMDRLSREQRPTIRSGYVKSFDGTRLFYSTEGQGKPLIFCYGLICSSLHWTYQIEHFRSAYQSVWFDYRGHHSSDLPKDLSSLTLNNMARDLGSLMDELGIVDAVILGHSMGVNVVLEFYRQQPQRVAGMILANGTAQRPLETLLGTNAIQGGFQLMKKLHQVSPKLLSLLWKSSKTNPFARTLVALGGFNPHLTPQADIDLYLEQVSQTDPALLLHLIENYNQYDARAWLHTVEAPTLIISGENDWVIPLEQQELLHQLIPQSQLEIVRHGSHCSQMDLPDLVNLRIEKFLSEINYAGASNHSTEISNQSSVELKSPAHSETS